MKTITAKVFEGNCSGGLKFDPDKLKAAIEEYASKDKDDRLVTDGNGTELSHICGKVNDISYENGDVYSEIELIDTPKGKFIEELIGMGIEFDVVPVGVCNVNEKKEVTDFELCGFSIINNP